MNNSKKIDILELVNYISASWLVLAVLMVAGGLAGFLISFAQKPVYESSASFGVTIDYTQTGALSDVQEDQAIRGVGSILLSDSLIKETLLRINSNGMYRVEENEFRDNAFSDRGDFRWTIRFRGNEPQRVFQIAGHWAAAAQETFDRTLAHAQTAESYLKILSDFQSCFQEAAPQAPFGFCGFDDPDELLHEISDLSRKIQAEKTASQGLFYALSIVLVNDPELSDHPVRYQTNLLVIAGAFAGLLIGSAYFAIHYYLGGRTS